MEQIPSRAPGSPVPFERIFDRAPRLVRGFLNSALHVGDLQQLYAQARSVNAGSLAEGVLDVLNVRIQITDEDVARIPRSGPLLIVANHPHGLLDGLLLDALIARIRTDVKMIANELLCDIEGLRERFIPLDVFGGRRAVAGNTRSIRTAIAWLQDGHVLGIFPAGEVSHWNLGQPRAVDPAWSALPVRCSALAKAAVLPVHIGGENSLAFQISGLVHPRLRTLRLPSELMNKAGRTIEIRIGSPIAAKDLAQRSEEQASDYLRARTYVLGHRKSAAAQALRPRLLPFRLPPRQQPIAGAMAGIQDEIARLDTENGCLVQSGAYAVYAEKGSRIPALLKEIGRLREITFRAVGEGTGRALDLDEFDDYYRHLILWNKEDATVAGSYRFAWTQDVLPERGARGLYTSTLFRFSPAFFPRIGPAIELGRSFVRPEYQRDHTPLLLLWQAIGRCVATRPQSPVLFGAVSISAEYSKASREIIVDFLRHRRFRDDLAALVEARRPFRPRLMRESELQLLAGCLHEIEDLNAPIRDIDRASGIPVLLRHYVKLGGRVAAFNVDRKFSDALDALLLVDLRQTPARLLGRYLGQDAATDFLARSSMNQPA